MKATNDTQQKGTARWFMLESTYFCTKKMLYRIICAQDRRRLYALQCVTIMIYTFIVLQEKCFVVQKGRLARRGGGVRANDADFKAGYWSTVTSFSVLPKTRPIIHTTTACLSITLNRRNISLSIPPLSRFLHY